MWPAATGLGGLTSSLAFADLLLSLPHHVPPPIEASALALSQKSPQMAVNAQGPVGHLG